MADAAYYREYRRKNAEHLRAYNKARRQQPKVRAQRHANEQRRRKRRRIEIASMPTAATPHGHSLFEQAVMIVGKRPAPGNQFAFLNEVDWEDAVSEVVLALLEGRDPVAARLSFRSNQRTIRKEEMPLGEWH